MRKVRRRKEKRERNLLFTKQTSHWEKEKNREPKKKDLFLASREKLLRAYGGCLGAECRRRTWDTAKSLGEL